MRKYLSLIVSVLICFAPAAEAQQVVNGNRVSVSGTGNQVQCANDATTGTTINRLAKMTSTGCLLAAITDTNIPLWIVTSASATTGNASMATSGEASCVMDTTIASGASGDYVIESVTTAGQCHPQSAQPSGVFVVGTLTPDATTSGSAANVRIVSTFVSGSSVGWLPVLQTGGLTLTSSQTTYHGFGSTTTAFSTAAGKSFSPAATCTAKNLRVKTNSTQNAGGSLVISVYDVTGAAATAVVATVTAGGTLGWYRDTTHSVVMTPENDYAIQFVNNFAGTSASVVEVDMQCN